MKKVNSFPKDFIHILGKFHNRDLKINLKSDFGMKSSIEITEHLIQHQISH